MRQRSLRKKSNIDDSVDELSASEQKAPIGIGTLSFDYDEEPVIEVVKKSKKRNPRSKRQPLIDDRDVTSTQISIPGSYTAEKLAELERNTPSIQQSNTKDEKFDKEPPLLKISGSFKPENNNQGTHLEAFIRVNQDNKSEEDLRKEEQVVEEDKNAFIPPNTQTIKLAKAKRERLRHAQLAPDYLPLGGASNLLSQDFKNTERDRLSSGSDSDDHEDNMKIQFLGSRINAKTKKLPNEDDYDMIEDEEEDDSFADMQTRKGVRSLGVSEFKHSQEQKSSQRTGFKKEVCSLPAVNRFSIQSMAEIAMENIEREIERLWLDCQMTEKTATVTKHNLCEALNDIKNTKIEIEEAEIRYKDVQEMRDYVSDLCDCLKEKLPYIEEMEEHLVELYNKEAQLIETEEDMCKEDKELADTISEVIHEVMATSASPGMAKIRSEEAALKKESTFVSNEEDNRSENRKRRWEALQDIANDETVDLKKDPFLEKAIKELNIENHLREMQQTGRTLFSDTLPMFGNLHFAKAEFEQWKLKQKKIYSMAYVPESLPALLAPFVRLEILTWSPFHGSEIGLESQNWYTEIERYGADTEENELMPELIKQMLVPAVRQQISKCWSPFYFQKSDIASEMIREMLVYVRMEDMEIQRLLQMIQEKVLEAVDICGMPPYSQIALTTSEIVQNVVEVRFHRCLNLIGSITCFHDILPFSFLRKVLFEQVICSNILPYLRGISSDSFNASNKVIKIFKLVPHDWIQELDNSRELSQIIDLLNSIVRSLAKQRKTLLKQHEQDGHFLKQIASFTDILIMFGASQKASELQGLFF